MSVNHRWLLFLAFVVAIPGCAIAETKVATTYHPERAGDHIEVSIEFTFSHNLK